jgi:hypothetical protein
MSIADTGCIEQAPYLHTLDRRRRFIEIFETASVASME